MASFLHTLSDGGFLGFGWHTSVNVWTLLPSCSVWVLLRSSGDEVSGREQLSPRWPKRSVSPYKLFKILSSEEVVGWNLVDFVGQSFFFLSAWELTFHQHSSCLLVLICCASGLCVRILFIIGELTVIFNIGTFRSFLICLLNFWNFTNVPWMRHPARRLHNRDSNQLPLLSLFFLFCCFKFVTLKINF